MDNAPLCRTYFIQLFFPYTLALSSLLTFITSWGCDNEKNSGKNYSNDNEGGEIRYRGVQERTEENVDDWQYDGRRSEDGIDWEFIDRAREAFFTGK